MMRYGLIAVLALVSACAQMQTAADDATRRQAKNAVDIVVAQKLPGNDISHVTDCIIDNANTQELLKLAAATVTGVTNKTTALVGEISSRPGTLKCMLQNSIDTF